MAIFTDLIRANAGIQLGGPITPGVGRSSLLEDSNAVYHIPWHAWRIHDAYQTALPGTSSGDDLALIGGTFGSASPSIQTYDVKGAGAVTLYARAPFQLPPEYVAGLSVTGRFIAGMLTTIADTSATIDLQAYKSDNEAGVGSDLVSDAAQSINSTSLAAKDFTIDPASLSPGDWLDLRVAIAINDGTTVTEVKGIIGAAMILLDIKG